MRRNSTKILTISLLVAFLSIFPLVFNKDIIASNTSISVPKSSNSSSIVSNYNTWGGSGDDWADGIATDASGNVYMDGMTSSFGTGVDDAFLVKYNSAGLQLWNTTWGGSGKDGAARVAIDSSGYIYMFGTTDSYGAGGNDIFLVKYNSAGVQLWNTTWGGPDDDQALYMAIDSANNIYLTGMTNSFGAGGYDAFLLKYNSSGALQWNTTWGGQEKDAGYSLYAASENNIYLAGFTFSFGVNPGVSDNIFLADYNSAGVQKWNTTWGGNGVDGCRCIAADSFGNIYLFGQSNSFTSSYDAILVKFSSTGTEQWYRTWGGSNNEDGFGIVVDSNNYIYVTGKTNSYGVGGYDIFLAKYNTNGAQLWNTTWGGINDDMSNYMTINSMGDVYITGQTDSFGAGSYDALVLKYSFPHLLSISEPNPNPNGTVSLKWKASAGAISYNIYRSTQNIEDITNFVPINTIKGTNYTDSGLADGSYYYLISAVYSNGVSGPSDPLSIIITSSTIHPPNPLDLLKNIFTIVLILFIVALAIVVSILIVASVRKDGRKPL